MGLSRSLLLYASESRWLARNLPRYPFARRAVLRFMPGERLDDALAEAARLGESGAGTVITRLGENINNLNEAQEVEKHYIEALEDIAKRALPVQLSVKLTQLGLDISWEHAARATSHITQQSASLLDAPVWIDMESSRYTDATLAVFRHTRTEHEKVGICLQAYLGRTANDLDTLLTQTTAIRLVKGAYNEPANIALQSKHDVDANYLACATRMLEAVNNRAVGHVPAFATHDVAIIDEINRRANRLAVAPDQYEFQMLYGIRPDTQRSLHREGYRLRVLISYGSAWFAWYMRRLAERPENVWFVVKSLF